MQDKSKNILVNNVDSIESVTLKLCETLCLCVSVMDVLTQSYRERRDSRRITVILYNWWTKFVQRWTKKVERSTKKVKIHHQ